MVQHHWHTEQDFVWNPQVKLALDSQDDQNVELSWDLWTSWNKELHFSMDAAKLLNLGQDIHIKIRAVFAIGTQQLLPRDHIIHFAPTPLTRCLCTPMWLEANGSTLPGSHTSTIHISLPRYVSQGVCLIP